MPIPEWRCLYCYLSYSMEKKAKKCENTHEAIVEEKFGKLIKEKVRAIVKIEVGPGSVEDKMLAIGDFIR